MKHSFASIWGSDLRWMHFISPTIHIPLQAVVLSADRAAHMRVKRGEYESFPIELAIVRVWEPNPPQGTEALEWLLLTNEPAETPEGVGHVARWYA